MRTFIAINLSENERERIHRAARPLRDSEFPIRWVRPENVHLTLGRARRRAVGRDFEGFDEVLESLDYEDHFEVETLDLVRSDLRPDGARYSVIHSAVLEGR